MSKYYTHCISKELCEALINKGFHASTTMTYGEVIDKLTDCGFYFSIASIDGVERSMSILKHKGGIKCSRHLPLLKTLEQAIFLALEFIE